jgi:hypothetical protein
MSRVSRPKIVYHGTSIDHLSSIRKHGLLTKFVNKNYTYGAVTPCVFISTDRSVACDWALLNFEERAALIKVVLPPGTELIRESSLDLVSYNDIPPECIHSVHTFQDICSWSCNCGSGEKFVSCCSSSGFELLKTEDGSEAA